MEYDAVLGLPCNECQENLFKRIQRGEFDFPEPEWETVSEEAKDLICHLLVCSSFDSCITSFLWFTSGLCSQCEQGAGWVKALLVFPLIAISVLPVIWHTLDYFASAVSIPICALLEHLI